MHTPREWRTLVEYSTTDALQIPTTKVVGQDVPQLIILNAVIYAQHSSRRRVDAPGQHFALRFNTEMRPTGRIGGGMRTGPRGGNNIVWSITRDASLPLFGGEHKVSRTVLLMFGWARAVIGEAVGELWMRKQANGKKCRCELDRNQTCAYRDRWHYALIMELCYSGACMVGSYFGGKMTNGDLIETFQVYNKDYSKDCLHGLLEEVLPETNK